VIKRLVIRNYRGIEERSIEVSPSGAIVKGRNGAGKTTVLKAIQAALEGRDIGPDAIRKGAAKGEILVDLDDISVRRAITAKGSTVTVTRDGMQAKAPQTFLRELLGTSSLDPMDLLTKKGKERRGAVLAALPVTVTVEQLRQWVPRLADGFDCSGHGLEVVERVRAKAYDQRTEANKTAKGAKEQMDRLAREAEDAAAVAPPECFEPGIESLTAELETAKRRVVELASQKDQAAKANDRTTSAREKVTSLRSQAKMNRDAAVYANPDDLGRARAAEARCIAEIDTLKRRLRELEDSLPGLAKAVKDIEAQNMRADCAVNVAAQLEQQANDLESTITAASVEAPSDEQIQAANDEAMRLARELDEAKHQAELKRKAEAAKTAADDARKAWDTAAAEAGRLDGIVRALTEDAPAQLLAACDGIPGLALDGDDVLLDGVRLDALCGAEQVRFCVEVARRANAKSKILVVDGLERLDPEQLDVFVREATRGGWQLIATRVDRGDVVIEAIEPGPVAAEAAE
jgi:hypothetical protein